MAERAMDKFDKSGDRKLDEKEFGNLLTQYVDALTSALGRIDVAAELGARHVVPLESRHCKWRPRQ